jgi:integrase
MARLRLEELQSFQHAPRTVSAYASDWKDFVRWCADSAKESLPAHPDTVALYLSHLVPLKKVSTLERRMAAIGARHQAAGLPSPTTPLVRSVIAGARRKNRRTVSRKAAITRDELLLICEHLEESGTVRATRDRAAILMGFAGAFRRSELVGLDLADIDLRRDRVEVRLNRSKTDQLGQGRELVLPRAKHGGLCVVRALAAWLGVRGRSPGPLFQDVSIGADAVLPGRMADHIVYYALRTAAARVGLDATKFGAHSLRAGACTAAADAGADIFEIMALSGHKSVETLGRYVRRSTLNYPLRKVL